MIDSPQTFRLPKWYRAVGGGAILFFSVVLVLSVMYGGQRQAWLFLIVYIPMIWSGIYLWKISERYIMADSAGLAWLSPNKPRVFIGWSEIGRVQAHDYLQRFDVYDATGRKVMHLDYQLEGFEVLRELLLSHTRHLQSKSLNPSAFIGSGRLALPLAILFFSAAALFMFHDNAHVYGLLATALAIASLVQWLFWTIMKVYLHDEWIELQYPARRRLIPYTQITGVDFILQPGQYGSKFAVVVLTTADGKKVKLARFKEGSQAVFTAVEAAWKLAQNGIRASR